MTRPLTAHGLVALSSHLVALSSNLLLPCLGKRQCLRDGLELGRKVGHLGAPIIPPERADADDDDGPGGGGGGEPVEVGACAGRLGGLPCSPELLRSPP